jgi:RimJ/RimL family protein N-acetyltransferase
MSDPTVTMRTIVNGTTVIGNIVAFKMGEVREVGYWLGREYWGRGAATTALCDFLKVERQRPLHATVASHNIGSIRVLQKCGFARISQFVGETGTLMQVFLLEEVG